MLQGITFECFERVLNNQGIDLELVPYDLTSLKHKSDGEYIIESGFNPHFKKSLRADSTTKTLADAYADKENIKMDGVTKYYTQLKYEGLVKGTHQYQIHSMVLRYIPSIHRFPVHLANPF